MSDSMYTARFDTIETAIEAIRNGGMVIVADDEDRENEGDLVCAAQCVTPEMINFMATEGRGLICLTLTAEHCQKLQLPQMASASGHMADPFGTAFTVSIDAHTKYGVTTGISASDRAKTIQVAVAPDAVAADLRRPGHIFPLQAKPGGVLERVGQTEASVDLARLAGLTPAGVICEMLNPDGSMSRRDELFAFAEKHQLPFITVAQLVAYRLRTERTVTMEAQAELPTPFGVFRAIAYRNTLDGSEHMALALGDFETQSSSLSEDALQGQLDTIPLVRVHSECLTGDVFGSQRCDCGAQLNAALAQIAEHGAGVLVYLRNHEGRGIGLVNKIKAYHLQEAHGLDTVDANLKMGFPADLRQYGVGAQILHDLGLTRFRLLTNNPRKIRGLDGYGLQIVDRVPIVMPSTPSNANYLAIKRQKLGHLL
ncbi:MAG: bifunctional 3,4-dihydroxy-2-butanone-4-phosphate synthase/GTP cyclohydrolase II [Vampirovibrionales bacterium]|nr:bifunctional 3,4-dihydroxy-2-butanone-4-phosphate synthase/GTP cyclohydrolase II [Vampirovibrionales bacterium]